MTKNTTKELATKENKLKSLIEKKFLFRDLFFGLFIYLVISKVLGFLLSSVSDILIFSIIAALAFTTALRRRIYKDRLKAVQLKIEKLSKNK